MQKKRVDEEEDVPRNRQLLINPRPQICICIYRTMYTSLSGGGVGLLKGQTREELVWRRWRDIN